MSPLLAALILLAAGIVLFVLALAAAIWLAATWLERHDRAAAEERDRRDQERLARYDEHLAEMNGRPLTSAITMRATPTDRRD